MPAPASAPDPAAEFSQRTCGRPAPAPSVVDALRARWTGVEDYRARWLVVLADSDAASAHLAALRDFYADCEEQAADGFRSPFFVVATETGEESFGVGRFEVSGSGAPTTAFTGLHVVRVGRSVLVDTAGNEGGAAPGTRAEITADQLRQMTADTADVVAAQCAFTDAGC